LKDPPKFTLIGIFGLKIYHLATLIPSARGSLFVLENFFIFLLKKPSSKSLTDLSRVQGAIAEKKF
jgi:hypothetical protein